MAPPRGLHPIPAHIPSPLPIRPRPRLPSDLVPPPRHRPYDHRPKREPLYRGVDPAEVLSTDTRCTGKALEGTVQLGCLRISTCHEIESVSFICCLFLPFFS